MASRSRERKLPQKCPVCPALSKCTFDEVGLFQHAIAISKYNANPEIVRAHNGLLNNLKGRLNNFATTSDFPLLHEGMNMDLPYRSAPDQDIEMKLVWPWTGILMNINCERIAKNGKNSHQFNNGKAINNPLRNIDLMSHFAHLNPRGVLALWNQGIAVLNFGEDLLGYFNARDFEKGFAQCERGKLEFGNMIKHRKEWVQEMFGWIADENDYYQKNSVGEILRKSGALRAEPHFREVWTEQQSKLREKDMKLMQLGKEVCYFRNLVYQSENEKYSTKAQFLLKERKHKQELKTINEQMSKATKSHNDELKEKIDSLQAELRGFEGTCQRLEENNTQSTLDETLIPKLIELVEEKEGLQDTIEKLIYKEREVNDKYQKAMDAAKEVLEIKGNAESFGIKRVGVMNDGPWKKACAQRFKDHKEGWETPCASLVSVWEDEYLRDPSWYPYKVVTTEGGKFEEHIDPNDERLLKLRQDFGAEVHKTVVDALNELQEFNASGRYPIKVPWNFESGRAAQLDEIIKYLAFDCSKKRKSSLG